MLSAGNRPAIDMFRPVVPEFDHRSVLSDPVKKGQTIKEIADQMGVTPRELIAANKDKVEKAENGNFYFPVGARLWRPYPPVSVEQLNRAVRQFLNDPKNFEVARGLLVKQTRLSVDVDGNPARKVGEKISINVKLNGISYADVPATIRKVTTAPDQLDQGARIPGEVTGYTIEIEAGAMGRITDDGAFWKETEGTLAPLNITDAGRRTHQLSVGALRRIAGTGDGKGIFRGGGHLDIE